MKKQKVCILLLALFFTMVSGCTIVYDSPVTEAETADPMTKKADAVWKETVLPYIEKNGGSVDDAIEANKKDAAKVYFPIIDEVTVTGVELESKSRTLTCKTGMGNFLKVQLGPIVKGTAIRDGVEGIDADNFTNQIEFAALSREFNKISIKQVDESIDFAAMLNKKIRVEGILQIKEENYLSLSSLKNAGD